MKNFVSRELCKGAVVRDLTDKKFKTMRISLNIILPLELEAAGLNALLPALCSRATLHYPDYTLLSKHLADLYGACLDCSVSKIGDNQVLSIFVSGIANRYALAGEDLGAELSELLCSAVFSPVVDENCMFGEEAFKQEKRQLLETIDADYNDKRIFANGRCMELMFAGEPAGLKRYGSREKVEALTRDGLLETWLQVVQRGRFEIFVLGDCDFGTVCKSFGRYFDIERFPVSLGNRLVLRADKAREITEEHKVAQSKLAMGFRTGVIPEDSIPTRVMSVLLGGTASSKFFVNIREKESLCYYCSSKINEPKGVMFVESGVETENIEKTRDAVLAQLSDVQNGKFTEEELNYAKLAMLNSYRAVGDSLGATENWYLHQAFADVVLTPEETADRVADVTRIEVIAAARKVSLDTVYILKGVGCDAE